MMVKSYMVHLRIRPISMPPSGQFAWTYFRRLSAILNQFSVEKIHGPSTIVLPSMDLKSTEKYNISSIGSEYRSWNRLWFKAKTPVWNINFTENSKQRNMVMLDGYDRAGLINDIDLILFCKGLIVSQTI